MVAESKCCVIKRVRRPKMLQANNEPINALPNPTQVEAEFPAELSGIADEDYRRKVRCAVGKSSEPRTYRAATQDKAVHIGSVAAAVNTDTDHQRKEQNQN